MTLKMRDTNMRERNENAGKKILPSSWTTNVLLILAMK